MSDAKFTKRLFDRDVFDIGETVPVTNKTNLTDTRSAGKGEEDDSILVFDICRPIESIVRETGFSSGFIEFFRIGPCGTRKLRNDPSDNWEWIVGMVDEWNALER